MDGALVDAKEAVAPVAGAQKGLLRIKCVVKGVIGAVGKGTDFRNHVKLKFGYVPRFGDECFDGMKCPFIRVEEDLYEIKVEVDLLAAAIEDQKSGNVRKIA